MNIEQLKEDHKELLQIATQISEKLDPESLSKDADEVLELLSVLLTKLGAHLREEDIILYPSLVNHYDGDVSSIAARFIDEMSDLSAAVNLYAAKWDKKDKIESDTETFIKETTDLFHALQNRIHREDTELYPIAADI